MGESANFKANERIPTRPLSYEHVELRMPKELIIDYSTAAVYISDENSNIVDFTAAVADVISQDPQISDKITVEDPDHPGEAISINDAVAGLDTKIINNTETINQHTTSISSLNSRVTDIENNYAQITSLSSVAFSGSYTDLSNQPSIKDTIIDLPIAWVGSNPTYQTVSVSGITANMCPPIIDLVHIGGSFENEKQEDNDFGKIYKAELGNGNITFYATEAPTVALRLRIRTMPGMNYT